MRTQTSTSTIDPPVTSTQATTRGQDIGLLALRLTVGLLLVAHGAQKLFGWFGGGGLDGTAAFLGQVGYSPAKLFAVITGVTELGGGMRPAVASVVVGLGAGAVTLLVKT
ncbi:DoxX family protein [Streptomyces sp. NPDC056361]|uniref:DoxX family protein n=1 Tax=Streptomyces sp. NPDC056361 TaxID=3345795 RepID=UPI0035DC217D